MKNILIIVFVFTGFIAFGQSPKTDTIKIADLEVPTSPGFSILDAAPNNIEHPTTANALAFNIINALTTNGLGVEFTPFWYLKTKNMNVRKYIGLNNDNSQNIMSSIKFVSISLAATTKMDSTSKKTINNYSFGARLTLLKLYKESQIANIQNELNRFTAILKSTHKNCLTGDLDSCLNNNKAYIEAKKNIEKAYSDFKPVFSINGATAIYYNDYNSTTNFGRFGVWLTADYNFDKFKNTDNYFHITLLSRYISDGTNKDKQNNYFTKNYWDTGLKLSLEFNRFSLAYEYISRNTDISNYRSAGLFKYKIRDALFISGSFGKNFNDTGTIALFGIHMGISDNNKMALQ
jgi:hypothetical protein